MTSVHFLSHSHLAQVRRVQNEMSFIHDSETKGYKCFLSGDGKGMVATSHA